MKKLLLFLLVLWSLPAYSWEVVQVKINHVQVDEISGYFYITVGENDISQESGCNQAWRKKNWIGFKLDPNKESQKVAISVAMAAYMGGKLVDVGSGNIGCIVGKPVSHFGYIRMGDYR